MPIKANPVHYLDIPNADPLQGDENLFLIQNGLFRKTPDVNVFSQVHGERLDFGANSNTPIDTNDLITALQNIRPFVPDTRWAIYTGSQLDGHYWFLSFTVNGNPITININDCFIEVICNRTNNFYINLQENGIFGRRRFTYYGSYSFPNPTSIPPGWVQWALQEDIDALQSQSGTWTPTTSTSGVTLNPTSQSMAFWQKLQNRIFINVRLILNVSYVGGGGFLGLITINGLPEICKNPTPVPFTCNVNTGNANSSIMTLKVHVDSNSNIMYIYNDFNQINNDPLIIDITGSYEF